MGIFRSLCPGLARDQKRRDARIRAEELSKFRDMLYSNMPRQVELYDVIDPLDDRIESLLKKARGR